MLYILDLDGTLCDRDSTEIYPHVRAWLESQRGKGHQFVIATNQGGVGWRYWLETDPPTWAVERGITPDGLPTEDEAHGRVIHVGVSISNATRTICSIRYCYAYVDRSGNRGPTPPGHEGNPVWMYEFRKPAPGMLQAAMMHARVAPADTIMIGDRDEDMQAALAAGCGFAWAHEFEWSK